MKLRSPVMGFNHNVRHLGRVYHVQTEDSGVKNPHLFTHVFFGGTILATKKVVYDAGADEAMVRALMQKQHRDMLREFKAGTHDDKLRSFFATRGEPAEVLGEGPLESEPEEIQPQGSAAMQQAAAAVSQWEQMAAKAAAEKPADAPDPFAGDEAPVITLAAPAPRAPSRPSTPVAPQPRAPTPSPRAEPDDDQGPVITLSAPPGRVAQSEPAAPKAAGVGTPSTMARRIWAKKGGAAERPFEDSGVFNALAGTMPSRPAAEDPKSANKSGTAEIVDLPPHATPPPIVSPLRPPPPPRSDPPEEGPLVVLLPPRSMSEHKRPLAEPIAPPRSSRPTSTPRVQIAAPSADGVVIARPPSVVVSGSMQSGQSNRPVPPVGHPASVPRTMGSPSPTGAAGGKQTKPPVAAREAPADSIFGGDLISEKSLDEVILAYLAEDAKHPK